MDHNHDHNHDHGTSDGSGTASCPMIMVFHGGHCERILWKSWVASTLTEFILSALAFFLLAFFYEGLKCMREFLKRQSVRREAAKIAKENQGRNTHCPGSSNGDNNVVCSNLNLASSNEKSYLARITAGPHLVQTLINLIQIVIAYLLMLVFMNYNYWLCLAIVLGLGVGYFFFGWIRTEAYDHECCE